MQAELTARVSAVIDEAMAGDATAHSLGRLQHDGAELLEYRLDRGLRSLPTVLRLVHPQDRAGVQAVVDAGRVHLVLSSQVREIRPDVVVLEVAGDLMILPNDDVIVRIGGDAPYTFLQRLGIRIVRKDIPLAPEQAQAG